VHLQSRDACASAREEKSACGFSLKRWRQSRQQIRWWWVTLNFDPGWRRYARQAIGFSRMLENHAAAAALNYSAYNSSKFIVHFAVGSNGRCVTDRLWDVDDL